MPDVKPRSTVYNSDQTHRLRMFDVVHDGGGGDFHSLVWARLVAGDVFGGQWETIREITTEEFQWGHPFRRFVSRLHSLSPPAGTAIIQIGEGDSPVSPRPHVTHFHYSWRLWDLKNNKELKVLKRCADPFEWYEASDDDA